MAFTNTIAAVCLAYMAAVVAVTVVPICRAQGRREKLRLLRNFKRGNFVLIYFAAIPLYWMAHVFNGEQIGAGLLLAIKSCVDLVVLKYDYSSAAALMAANTFYRAVIDISFVLVAVNAVVFSFTLVGQRMFNFIANRRSFSAKKLYLIVGFNKENIAVLKSVREERGRAVLICKGEKEAADEVFLAGRSYVRVSGADAVGAFIEKRIKNLRGRSVYAVVNTGDDAGNLLVCEKLCGIIDGLNADRPSENTGLFAYVFGAPENTSAFVHFMEKSKGRIRYVNKYKLVAADFINRYPYTRYMGAREIDGKRALVRPEAELGIVFVGFGKANQQLFLTSVANDQFVTRSGGEIVQKPVHYTIFDKKDSHNDKNLNHSYFRYRSALHGIIGREEEYLPLVPEPAETSFIRTDINDQKFYETLRASLSAKPGGIAYNYLIIAFGTDLENLDLADKISAKLKEWGMADSTHLFVKIRSAKLSEEVVAHEYAEENDFLTFGEEERIVYDISRIVWESAERMAWRRHLSYTAEYERSASQEEIYNAALNGWYGRWRQLQREANVYACLSLRSKLNMLGFDYAPASDPRPDAEEEFMQKYTEGDAIRYTGGEVNGKKLIEYRNGDFERDSVRKTFAVQEHQRWNACMIAEGVIPSTKKEIAGPDRGKRLDLRRHGCLTTFGGLVEYRRILAEASGKDEEQTDVIRYDYQIMDDAAWLLGANGYKIVRRDIPDGGKAV